MYSRFSQLLNRTDVNEYWRTLVVEEAHRDAEASGEAQVLSAIALKFKVGFGKIKNKKTTFFDTYYIIS
jgi:hypothetical protein